MDAAERRARILEAAEGVLAEDGLAAARVRDVAERAGVAYGLVYHYFGSKEGLARAVFDDNWALFAGVVEGLAASGRPPLDALVAIIDYALNAWRAYPARLRVILVEAGRVLRQDGADGHEDVRRVVNAAAGRYAAVGAPHPALLARLLMGALEAGVTDALRGATPPDEAAATALREALHAAFIHPFRRTESGEPSP